MTDTVVERTQVSTEGLTDAEVLLALYNASRVVGMGIFSATSEPLTLEHCEAILEFGTSPDYGDAGQCLKPREGGAWIDYLYGKPLKVELNGSGSFDPWGFDRDNGGPGSAQRVIDEARRAKNG